MRFLDPELKPGCEDPCLLTGGASLTHSQHQTPNRSWLTDSAWPEGPLTCDLHSEEGEDLEEEDGYPAHGVGEDDEEEALGDGDLVVECHLPGRFGCFLHRVEHAGVGEHDQHEGKEVQT